MKKLKNLNGDEENTKYHNLYGKRIFSISLKI